VASLLIGIRPACAAEQFTDKAVQKITALQARNKTVLFTQHELLFQSQQTGMARIDLQSTPLLSPMQTRDKP